MLNKGIQILTANAISQGLRAAKNPNIPALKKIRNAETPESSQFGLESFQATTIPVIAANTHQ